MKLHTNIAFSNVRFDRSDLVFEWCGIAHSFTQLSELLKRYQLSAHQWSIFFAISLLGWKNSEFHVCRTRCGGGGSNRVVHFTGKFFGQKRLESHRSSLCYVSKQPVRHELGAVFRKCVLRAVSFWEKGSYTLQATKRRINVVCW